MDAIPTNPDTSGKPVIQAYKNRVSMAEPDVM
jgi:hypothetical protein